MSEGFEKLRQRALAAKQERAEHDQKAREESKSEVVAELEESYQELCRLALQEAEINGKLSQLFYEIRTAGEEARKIREETIPAAEKDEAFTEQEGLRTEAIGMLQKEAEALEDSIPIKGVELERLRQQHREIKTEMQ